VSSQHGLLGDDIAGGGLSKETDWRGAFVIGLAGTILVTGIAPVMVNAFGAASIPQMAVITITGYLLCLLLAEMSAMMPDRTGGSPTYAMVAYKDKWPGFAGHVNGITCWAYWLGWFPVAPLNMIIAAGYLKSLFGWGDIGTFTPISTPIAWTTLIIAVVGIVGLFIPAYLGIRLGAAFATVLGLLSMIPLTILALGSIFRADIADWGQLNSPSWFPQVDGTGFWTPALGHSAPVIYLAFAFLLTWNVIAMEAAACYIGECKNPARDAKIAMNLEGAYGAFIYIMIPLSFVVILGRDTLGGLGYDPNTVFLSYAQALFGGNTGSALKWGIGLMLIIALALSALNAIMGCARGLHQMSIDGQFPRIFARVNQHGVPSFAMFWNVIWSIAVVFLGGAVQIYLFSNVGYLFSFLPVLVGYYLLRQNRPDIARPVRLPFYFKYIALAMFVFYAVIWAIGGPLYASLPLDTDFNPATDNGDGKVYYILGIVTLLLYFVGYAIRQSENKKHPGEPVPGLTDVEKADIIPDK
jgi:amino acid transporter